LRLGFRLGFGGTLTYPGSHRLRALATRLPLTAIVLETDAPDMPPVWLRQAAAMGGSTSPPRNAPVELPRIGETLAALRGIAANELAAQLLANICAALPGLLPGSGGAMP
jgi:TatD DNase family protein